MMLIQKRRKKFVFAAVMTFFASVLFFVGNQHQSIAATDPDLGNLGNEIVCHVYNELNRVGSPIPVLRAGDCQEPPSVPAQCIDGIDNDGDGSIDHPADPGCTSSSDDTEAPNPPPTAPLCSDGIDNDGDGSIDHPADPGCTSSTDTDETNAPPSNGGGSSTTTPSITPSQSVSSPSGGGGKGGKSGSFSPSPTLPQGVVLGVETCREYLFEYIKFGAKNNPTEVLKLQRFLRDLNGFVNLKETGIYDTETLAAVHEFQKMYATQILSPWGATRSTGYVYYTTKKTINEIHCKFLRQFPLSSQQEAEIARVKSLGKNLGQSVSIPSVQPAVPQSIKKSDTSTTSGKKVIAPSPQKNIEQSAAAEASMRGTSMRDWLKDILNWLQKP